MILDMSGLESISPIWRAPRELRVPKSSDKEVTPRSVAFIFEGGIIVAADSRVSMEGYNKSQSVKKIVEITPYMLAVIASGAVDSRFWHGDFRIKCRLYELEQESRISITQATELVEMILYPYRRMGLSVKTLITGWDKRGPQLHYVDNHAQGPVSGSRFSVGFANKYPNGPANDAIANDVLDEGYRYGMSIEEAADLAKKVIGDEPGGRAANVYHIGPQGWKKLCGDDIVLELRHICFPLMPNTAEQEEAEVAGP